MQEHDTLKSINKDSNERLRKNAKYYDEVFSKFDEEKIERKENIIKNNDNNYNNKNINYNNYNNIRSNYTNMQNANSNVNMNTNANNNAYNTQNRLRQNIQFEEDIEEIRIPKKHKKNLKWDMTPLDLIIYIFILVMFIFSVIMIISSR